MQSLIPLKLIFWKILLMKIWYVVICGWKMLEFHFYDVLTPSLCSSKQAINKSARRVGKWLTGRQTCACSEHTNKSLMLHLYNSLCGIKGFIRTAHLNIHAIRIKNFQYRCRPNSKGFSISTSCLGWYEISSPYRRTSLHSSFRNLASFVERGASMSSHRGNERDGHINLPAVLPE